MEIQFISSERVVTSAVRDYRAGFPKAVPSPLPRLSSWRRSATPSYGLHQPVVSVLDFEPCPLYDHQPERCWRHLDTCQYRTILHAEPPRSNCPEHGPRAVKLPWAEPSSRFTA